LDLDGTLVDSSPGIFHSYSRACRAVGLTPPEFDTFRSAIGPPIEDISKGFFSGLSDDVLEQLRKTFREDYDNKSFRMLTWHDKAKEIIPILAGDRRLALSIITNKPTSPTVRIIEDAGLLPHFQHVVGVDYCRGDLAGQRFAAKADAIRFTLGLAGCQSASCLYVGDTASDLQAAAKNNVRFVAATYGFYSWSADELEGHNSIRTFEELPDLLVRLGM
jgi:phosphoglycolate phosphatase